MARLSKQQIKNHNRVMDMVHSDKTLSHDDIIFILENYQEGATNDNSSAGAFFTPWELSRDFSLEVYGNKIIDLCAGIGGLSYITNHYIRGDYEPEFTCVELNPNYIEVGKRVFPQANWVQMDAIKFCMETEQKFDCVISNPPFGKIKTSDVQLDYTGSEFEYKVICAAKRIADYGAFIIPQMSAPFRYSGQRSYREELSSKCKRFVDQTGIIMQPNCGIDTSAFLDKWNGVSPMCEIVCVEYV